MQTVNWYDTFSNTRELTWAPYDSVRTKKINNKNKEENKNMENLYKIYIVEKNRNIHELPTVVAKNEEEAKHQAGVYAHSVFSFGVRLSDVTVIVQNLGSVVVEEESKDN